MGAAADWQAALSQRLAAEVEPKIQSHLIIYNPRRPDWDPTWEQRADNPNFAEQVNWELDSIESADLVVFVFDPDTKSPITLMELGLMLTDPDAPHIMLLCPEGYWRKGNVDIVVDRYARRTSNVTTVEDMDELIEAILGWAGGIEE